MPSLPDEFASLTLRQPGAIYPEISKWALTILVNIKCTYMIMQGYINQGLVKTQSAVVPNLSPISATQSPMNPKQSDIVKHDDQLASNRHQLVSNSTQLTPRHQALCDVEERFRVCVLFLAKTAPLRCFDMHFGNINMCGQYLADRDHFVDEHSPP